MEFGLDATQRQFDAALREFIRGAITLDKVRAAARPGSGFDAELWRQIRELGVPAILVPERHGGLGLGLLDAAVTAEALGYGSVPAAFVSAAVMAPLIISGCASPAQQAEWMPRMASGEMRIAVDIDGIRVQSGEAPRFANDRLRARARACIDGDCATHFMTVLRDGRPLLVEAAAPGVRSDVYQSLDRTRSLTNVLFEDAPAQLLDAAPEPLAEMRRALDAGRIALAADTVGAAQRMLDAAVGWAGERVQFGRVIGSFQGVKHALADAVTMLEPCRALVWHAAYAHDRRAEDARLLACHAKAHVGDVGREVARVATEAHGGMGFTDLLGLHYWLKRCAFDRQMLGTPAQCREEAARLQGWFETA